MKKRTKVFQDHPQGLVIFESKEEILAKELEKYAFEIINQEDKIKLANKFSPHAGHYGYSIFLSNQSSTPISQLKIKVMYPEFLSFFRCYPSTINATHHIEKDGDEEIKRIDLTLDVLNENTTKQIQLYFNTATLDDVGDFRTIFTYVNNKDYLRVINTNPIEFKIGNIAITPKIIPSSYIREFSQIPDINKAVKAIGIGTEKKVNFNFVFDILEQLLIFHNYQLIAKDVNKKILWFFGTEIESQDDILTIAQIISNKIEILSLSLNPTILVAFLTSFSNNFHERLVMRKILKPEEQIFDLECIQCGTTFQYFPKKGDSILCTKCNNEQVIW